MRNFRFKIDLTWRDVLMRAALVVCTTAIIVWFMPRDNRPNFKPEVGKVWRYNDLTATFDFPVQKSDSVIQAERAAALLDYEPYYTLNKQTAQQQEQLLTEQMEKEGHTMGVALKWNIIAQLRNAYRQGIVDTKEPVGGEADTLHTLRRIDDKETTSVRSSSVLTPRQAYELIMQSPVIIQNQERLQDLNLNDFIVPNLTYNSVLSDSVREQLLSSVPMSSGVVQRGQKIIDQGSVVTEDTYQVLLSFMKEIDRRHTAQSGFNTVILGEVIYVFLVILAFTVYLSLYRKDYFEEMRSIGMLYALIIVSTVMASLMVSHSVLHVYILPFVVIPIFIRVFMDSRTAFMAHTSIIILCACLLQKPLEFIAVEMAAGLAAIFSLREMSSRSQLFWTAVAATSAAMLANLAVYLIRNNDISRIDSSEYIYLAICGIVIFCCYPLLYLIEKFFGFISDITLIELSDMNKDLLRRMSEVAPGTFQHSIQVGNLAAEIARRIGANPQLVRTGALYHDIGKMQNPIYFTENQSGGINPHDQLSYIESAQMIISHVTEGLKLADKYNLPVQIRDLIATHHGQGKAKYFYIKYKNEHPDEPVDDLLFTYPGPNPFTKEQAILMMADAVEAASRSLPDYTEQSIRTLVNRIIDSMVDDGFFRECPITFRDIQYAKTVLIEKLKTIYHTRISYPEMKK
ncbi:MAG: HDIG domain-containing protein [Prevotella sp.]|nr:HDIG domain-containing protein [Prevotella sp.]